MSVRFLDTDFKNQIIIASCPLTETVERIRRCEAAGAGGVILKTCCDYIRDAPYEPRKVVFSDDQSRYYATAPFAREILTAGEGLALYREAAEICRIPLIPSVTAFSLEPEDWLPLCLAFQRAGAKILQLDFFYMGSCLARDDFVQKLRLLLRALLDRLACRVMPKVNIDLPADFLFRIFSEESVQGVSLLDSVRVPYPDSPSAFPASSTSCFGAWQLPLSLHYAAIAERYQLEVCGGGGVTDPAAVQQMINCGASLVQVASAVLVHGYQEIARLLPARPLTKTDTSGGLAPGFRVTEPPHAAAPYHIRADTCILCHRCTESAWCDAIRAGSGEKPEILANVCEGCGWCAARCPAGAIVR